MVRYISGHTIAILRVGVEGNRIILLQTDAELEMLPKLLPQVSKTAYYAILALHTVFEHSISSHKTLCIPFRMLLATHRFLQKHPCPARQANGQQEVCESWQAPRRNSMGLVGAFVAEPSRTHVVVLGL